MPYCDKYVIENQQEINQYHKNLLKDQKNVILISFIHHVTNIDIISMPIIKVGGSQILEIINRNPEITKRGRPITKREHESSPTRVSQNGTLFHGC